jgi:hypothetical protein
MAQFRRYLLSLILSVAMVLTVFGAASASADKHCNGMMMPGMGMATKSDHPCAPKAPECMDMSGCILAAAKLAEPLSLKRTGFWSVGAYSASTALAPSSTDIRPDHSPPKRIA